MKRLICKLPAAACCVLLSCVPISWGQTLYAEQRTPESLKREVTVRTELFTDKWITGYCGTFLKDTQRYHIRKLWISTELSGLPSLGSVSGVDNNYLLWRRLRDRLTADFGVAEMLAIGMRSVLRVRAPDGSITVSVLQAPNMLRHTVTGLEYEIVDMAIRRLPVVKHGETEQTLVELFVQTDSKLDQKTAERITRHIQNTFKVSPISVIARNDPVFLDLDFPIVFPFAPLTPPLTQQEFSRSPECHCSGELKRVECHCVNTWVIRGNTGTGVVRERVVRGQSAPG